MVVANQDFYTVRFNDLEVEEIITQVDIKPWRILREKTHWEGIERVYQASRSAVTVYAGSGGND